MQARPSTTEWTKQKKERICELEDRTSEIIQSEEKKKKEWKRLRKPMWSTGVLTIKTNNSRITEVPDRQEREKTPKSLCKEIRKAEYFQNLGEIWTCKFMKLIGPQIQLEEMFFETHNNKTAKDQRQRRNLKSSKRKAACNLQKNPHKAITGFLSRNLTGQETLRWHTQHGDRQEKHQPRILWQNCPSEMKERQRLSQTNESWGRSSPLDLPYKKW